MPASTETGARRPAASGGHQATAHQQHVAEQVEARDGVLPRHPGDQQRRRYPDGDQPVFAPGTERNRPLLIRAP